MGHFLIFILETFFKESYLYSHANKYCRKMVIVNATSVGRFDHGVFDSIHFVLNKFTSKHTRVAIRSTDQCIRDGGN